MNETYAKMLGHCFVFDGGDGFASRDRFYKTQFRPQTFCTYFHPQNIGQISTQKQ
jgi:hypothetical protein